MALERVRLNSMGLVHFKLDERIDRGCCQRELLPECGEPMLAYGDGGDYGH